MPVADRKVDYISWSDVFELWRWLEQGYSVQIFLHTRVSCPVGEQYLKAYGEMHVSDPDGQQVPFPSRQLGSFPNASSKTYPGMLLGMLYALDSALADVRVWVEPTIAAQPRRAER